MSEWPWETRRDGEQTPMYLGRVLDWISLHNMARRAREGHYDDFFAPPEVADGLEILRLYNDLLRAASRMQLSGQRERMQRTLAVADAVKAGEFDATKEESDRWAASADGQAAFRMLTDGR